MDSLNIVVPSVPLPWWITSNISKWRFLVDIAGIKDSNPQDLAIFDWKIVFEISLRHNASIWRLCPSLHLGRVQIPIFGIVQEVDFVTGKTLLENQQSPSYTNLRGPSVALNPQPGPSAKPPQQRNELELKHDELTIFNMDSSFAPVTRRQAALVLNKDPKILTHDVKLKRVSLAKDSTIQRTTRSNKSINTDLASDSSSDEDEETEDESDNDVYKPPRDINRFGLVLREPCESVSLKEAPPEQVKNKTVYTDDYTDEEDLILDSDTPDIELLTDSADEAEHRDRKLRRRERKESRN
ncbi:hypothetical protein ABW20_dc0103393 [Dactylellina cionopaga]|nr:hypothetical protein ABW20_dc0103393 [Dactylellina cionopaga]